jgi:two-component system, NtrC family, response regulator AtoC
LNGHLALVLLQRLSADSGRNALTLFEGARNRIQQARWPGNIRELRKVLERASIMLDGNEISAQDLDLVVSPKKKSTLDEVISLQDLEQLAIKRALELTQGNRKEAAEKLGISLRTLYGKLKLYEIK